MANRIAHSLTIALAAFGATGCGSSPQPHYYTFEPTATLEGAASADFGVTVGPVSIPASVDRPQIVVQIAPNRVVLDEFHRWAGPLDDTIARAVAGNLAVLLGTPRVSTSRLANFDPAYRVAIDVQRFDSTPGEGVLVDAVWSVRKAVGGEGRSGRTTARETVEGKAFEAIAAAHGRAIDRLSEDIAAVIREEAAKTP